MWIYLFLFCLVIFVQNVHYRFLEPSLLGRIARNSSYVYISTDTYIHVHILCSQTNVGIL